jgi:putative membrane protein
MKKIYHFLAIAASLTLVSCNESRRGNDSNLNEDRNEAAAESNSDKFEGTKQRDAGFVYDVVGSSYGEIKLAELANQRSRTAEVKQIAQQLLTDHTASLNELKTLAQAKAISIPVEEADASKRKLENMAEEEGSDFDKEWVQEMIDLHEKNIDTFEDRLKNTEDPELKAFISKTLPVLKKHHEHLRACEEKLDEGKG